MTAIRRGAFSYRQEAGGVHRFLLDGRDRPDDHDFGPRKEFLPRRLGASGRATRLASAGNATAAVAMAAMNKCRIMLSPYFFLVTS